MKRYEFIIGLQGILFAILLVFVVDHWVSHYQTAHIHEDTLNEYYELWNASDIYGRFNDYDFVALGDDYYDMDLCYKPLLDNLCDCAYEHLPIWEAEKWCN